MKSAWHPGGNVGLLSGPSWRQGVFQCDEIEGGEILLMKSEDVRVDTYHHLDLLRLAVLGPDSWPDKIEWVPENVNMMF